MLENMTVGLGITIAAFWAFIAAVVLAGVWDSIRKRDAQHETLRRMVENGNEIDPELMDKLLGVNKRLDRDLRLSGLIMFSIAPGLAAFAWLLSLLAAEALYPVLGASVLCVFIGIGLMIAANYVARTNNDETPVPQRQRR